MGVEAMLDITPFALLLTPHTYTPSFIYSRYGQPPARGPHPTRDIVESGWLWLKFHLLIHSNVANGVYLPSLTARLDCAAIKCEMHLSVFFFLFCPSDHKVSNLKRGKIYAECRIFNNSSVLLWLRT